MNNEKNNPGTDSKESNPHTPVNDSSNPGNKFVKSNKNPKDMEKKGFNNQAKTKVVK